MHTFTLQVFLVYSYAFLRFMKGKHKNPQNHKLMLGDTITWHHRFMTIADIINEYPLELWKRIHPDNNYIKNADKISLVRPAYAKLKTKIKNLQPELVALVDAQHEKQKAKRKLLKEINNNTLNTGKSKFRSLGKRKV